MLSRLSRRLPFLRRPRSWLLAALCLASLWLALGPGRWLRERVREDQDALNALLPAYRIESGERVLLVSPHLDDETLGAGGLLASLAARKVPLRVVFLTNGDGSGSTILALNFSHGRRFSFVESALLRQHEALAALARLGVARGDVAFLGYPDGDLQTLWDRWDGEPGGAPIRSRFTQLLAVPYANAPGAGSPFLGASLLRDLAAQMEAFAPTRVLSTHGADSHPDHWSADAFSRLALQVLAERQSRPAAEHDGFVIHHGIFPLPHGNHPGSRLSLPSALLSEGSPNRPGTNHPGTNRPGTTWRSFELSDAERASKGAALEEYRSQLVFTPNYLRAFVRRNEPLGRTWDGAGAQAWFDETQESWFLAQHPGADVKSISVQARAPGLELLLGLDGRPAAGVVYRFNIKSVLARGRVLSNRCSVAAQGDGLVARELGGAQPIAVRKNSSGFALVIPWNALGGGARKPRRVVIDASTWNAWPERGAVMLDRTESRAIVLN